MTVNAEIGDDLLTQYGETGEVAVDAVDLAASLAVSVCANEGELSAFVDSVQEAADDTMKGA